MAGLGDLVSGFQGGYNFAGNAQRNKRLNKAIDYELADMGTKQMGRRSAIDLARGEEGRGQVDWDQFDESQDPVLFRLGRGVKKFFSKQHDDNAPYAGIPANPEASGSSATGTIPKQGVGFAADGGAMRKYANGGRSLAPNRTAMANGGFAHPNAVGEAGRGAHYADGGQVEESQEEKKARFARMIEREPNGDAVTSGGGFGAAMGDVGRAILPNTRQAFNEADEYVQYTDSKVGEAEGAANKGAALRNSVGERLKGTAHIAGGLLEDSGVSPMIRGVGGALGYGTDAARAAESAEGSAISNAVGPDESSVAAQPAAPDAGLGGQTNATAVSTSGEANQPGVGGGGNDGSMDLSKIQGMTPDDVPSMNTQDWIAYRSTKVSDLIAMGSSPTEAHKQVTEMQMRGFHSNAQRASFALQSGDVRTAALQLKAAYQYFPNGADVRFGMTQDKQGRPALVSMGVNEETGDPQGNPVLINEERLAAMINNFSSPDKFTAWTKDWRAEEFMQRKYEEVEKPTAQSDANYRGKAGDAALLNAQAARQRASNSASGGAGGIKASDRDRAAKDEFKERAFSIASIEDVEDPDQLSADLTQVMGEIYTMNPNVPPTTISNEVVQAYRLRAQDGGQAMSQLLRRYGLVQ